MRNERKLKDKITQSVRMTESNTCRVHHRYKHNWMLLVEKPAFSDHFSGFDSDAEKGSPQLTEFSTHSPLASDTAAVFGTCFLDAQRSGLASSWHISFRSESESLRIT